MGELTRTTGSVKPSLSGEIFEMIRRWSKGGRTVARGPSFLTSISGGIGTDVPDTSVDPSLLFDDAIVPSPVGAAGSVGTAETPPRADHVHRGVASFAAVGQPPIYGDARVEAGVGISLEQTGNIVKITNTGAGTGGGGEEGDPPITQIYHEYRSGAEAVGQTFNLAFLPNGDVAVYFAGQRKTKGTHYLQNAQSITFASDVTIVPSEKVIFTYFYNPGGEPGFNIGLSDVAGRIVEYHQVLASTPMDFDLLYEPIGDVQVYFAGLRRFKGLHYTQTGDVIQFTGEIAFVDGDLVVFDYFYSLYGSSDPEPSGGGDGTQLDFSLEENSGHIVTSGA